MPRTASTSPEAVEIDIAATVRIQIDEIWPDGTAPHPVTADAVRQALEHDGPKPIVLMTWGLLDDATVTVTLTNPHSDLTTPLFPEHEPASTQTAQPWATAPALTRSTGLVGHPPPRMTLSSRSAHRPLPETSTPHRQGASD